MAFALTDYVQVNERIERFYEAHPMGSIQCEIHTLTDKLVVVRATAYRDPEDQHPCIAHSQLSIPGTTPYTKGSELENAETSAAGRALAMMGFEVKRSIASREEVAAKAASPVRLPAKAEKTLPSLLKELLVAARERGIRQYQVAKAIGLDEAPERMTSEQLHALFKEDGEHYLALWLNAAPDRSLDSLLDDLDPQEAA